MEEHWSHNFIHQQNNVLSMGVVQFQFLSISHLSVHYFQLSIMIFIKTKIGTLFSNTDLNNYYTKTEIGDSGNELPTLISNTYNQKRTRYISNRLL